MTQKITFKHPIFDETKKRFGTIEIWRGKRKIGVVSDYDLLKAKARIIDKRY